MIYGNNRITKCKPYLTTNNDSKIMIIDNSSNSNLNTISKLHSDYNAIEDYSTNFNKIIEAIENVINSYDNLIWQHYNENKEELKKDEDFRRVLKEGQKELNNFKNGLREVIDMNQDLKTDFMRNVDAYYTQITAKQSTEQLMNRMGGNSFTPNLKDIVNLDSRRRLLPKYDERIMKKIQDIIKIVAVLNSMMRGLITGSFVGKNKKKYSLTTLITYLKKLYGNYNAIDKISKDLTSSYDFSYVLTSNPELSINLENQDPNLLKKFKAKRLRPTTVVQSSNDDDDIEMVSDKSAPESDSNDSSDDSDDSDMDYGPPPDQQPSEQQPSEQQPSEQQPPSQQNQQPPQQNQQSSQQPPQQNQQSSPQQPSQQFQQNQQTFQQQNEQAQTSQPKIRKSTKTKDPKKESIRRIRSAKSSSVGLKPPKTRVIIDDIVELNPSTKTLSYQPLSTEEIIKFMKMIHNNPIDSKFNNNPKLSFIKYDYNRIVNINNSMLVNFTKIHDLQITYINLLRQYKPNVKIQYDGMVKYVDVFLRNDIGIIQQINLSSKDFKKYLNPMYVELTNKDIPVSIKDKFKYINNLIDVLFFIAISIFRQQNLLHGFSQIYNYINSVQKTKTDSLDKKMSEYSQSVYRFVSYIAVNNLIDEYEQILNILQTILDDNDAFKEIYDGFENIFLKSMKMNKEYLIVDYLNYDFDVNFIAKHTYLSETNYDALVVKYSTILETISASNQIENTEQIVIEEPIRQNLNDETYMVLNSNSSISNAFAASENEKQDMIKQAEILRIEKQNKQANEEVRKFVQTETKKIRDQEEEKMRIEQEKIEQENERKRIEQEKEQLRNEQERIEQENKIMRAKQEKLEQENKMRIEQEKARQAESEAESLKLEVAKAEIVKQAEINRQEIDRQAEIARQEIARQSEITKLNADADQAWVDITDDVFEESLNNKTKNKNKLKTKNLKHQVRNKPYSQPKPPKPSKTDQFSNASLATGNSSSSINSSSKDTSNTGQTSKDSFISINQLNKTRSSLEKLINGSLPESLSNVGTHLIKSDYSEKIKGLLKSKPKLVTFVDYLNDLKLLNLYERIPNEYLNLIDDIRDLKTSTKLFNFIQTNILYDDYKKPFFDFLLEFATMENKLKIEYESLFSENIEHIEENLSEYSREEIANLINNYNKPDHMRLQKILNAYM